MKNNNKGAEYVFSSNTNDLKIIILIQIIQNVSERIKYFIYTYNLTKTIVLSQGLEP